LVLSDTRSQVTILRSPVNLASRLESLAENNQIIISPYVKDLIRHRFNLQKVILKEHLQLFPEINIISATFSCNLGHTLIATFRNWSFVYRGISKRLKRDPSEELRKALTSFGPLTYNLFAGSVVNSPPTPQTS
jgi:hypothetical protein